MRYQFIQPSAVLAPYIKHYWMLETDPEEGNVCERVVPTDNLELMFHYRQPFAMTFPDQQQCIQPQSFVSGLSNRYMDASTQGASGVIAVDFQPYGASAFFPFPLIELENRSIHLDDIFAGEIRLIEEQIDECGNLHERIDVIEQFLHKKLRHINPTDLQLSRNAVRLIHQSHGQIQSKQLAQQLAMSPRNLERKFATLIGKSPKQYSRIVRFQRVMNGLIARQPHYLTDYAYNNGYFDQSHFIHEFKALSGYTPREFVMLCPCREDWVSPNL